MVSTRATAATAAEDPKVAGARMSKIKTYSRRRLTRRMSSPLVPKTEYSNEEPRPSPPRLIQRSFSELVASQHQQQPMTPTKKRHAQQQQPDFAVPGPKRARCMLTADKIQQTPTELFFKMISASAPELLQPHQQEEEEEAVLLSTEVDDDVLQEEENPPVEPVSLYNDKIKAEADEQVEVDEPEEQAMEAGSEKLIAEDEGDNDVLGEESPLNEQPDDPIKSSPASTAWQSFPPVFYPSQKASKTKGRFLAFKKADDRDDFNTIEKQPESQTPKRPTLKVSKKTSDGFDEDEKHAGPLRKQRRFRGSTSVGRLELTQRGTFTQGIQGPTWPRGQKKTRTTTLSSLWSRRQYVGSTQIKTKSDDLLDPLDEDTEPLPKNETRSGSRKRRQASIEELSDADEDVDVLVFLPDDVDDDEVAQDDGEVALLVEPDELGEEVDVDSLAVAPKTKTPEKDENTAVDDRSEFQKHKRPEAHLPPKRQWHCQKPSANKLALRPDANDGWARDVQE